MPKYFTIWDVDWDCFPSDCDGTNMNRSETYSPFFLSPVASPEPIEEDHPISRTIIEKSDDHGDDHNYSGNLSELQLPPVPLNIRPCRDSTSRSACRTTLKIFHSLSTLGKRKRKKKVVHLCSITQRLLSGITVWMFCELRSKAIIDGKIKITSDNLKEVPDFVWQKLRNDDVDLSILENLSEIDAFDSMKKKIVSMKRKKWVSRNCKKVTSSSKSILCDGCLDWLHLRCVGLKSPQKSELWMCPDLLSRIECKIFMRNSKFLPSFLFISKYSVSNIYIVIHSFIRRMSTQK